MTQKIIITEAGYDVLASPDPRHVTFDSDLASLKYYVESSTAVSGAAGYTTVEVTHGLGYVPFFVAYVGPLIEAADYSMVPFFFASGADFFVGSAWADSNKLYLQIWHNLPGTPSATFYYKIFKNSLGL